MPASAVMPAPLVFIKTVTAKKLVDGSRAQSAQKQALTDCLMMHGIKE